ncbi:hypothetical protein CC79DRAFT_1369433 [Sarocladium strictum]
MPRRPKPEEVDFEIHVDPSCLSAPRDDAEDYEDMTGRESLPEAGHSRADAIEELENQIREHLDQALEPETPLELADEPEKDEQTISPAQSRRTSALSMPDAAEDDDKTPTQDQSILSGDGLTENDDHANEDGHVEDSILSTTNHEASVVSDQDGPAEDVIQSLEGESLLDDERQEPEVEDVLATEDDAAQESRLQTPEPSSRRDSHQSTTSEAMSPRRASGRTEALIHAAARDIVAQIELGQDLQSIGEDDASFISETETVERTRISDAYSMTESRRTSEGAVEQQEDEAEARPADEGADSSSHHEDEDDVFSDHSPRDSVGSASDAAASDADIRKMHENVTRRSRTRSPRMSGMSGVSGFSQYEEDEEDFIPTMRGTPRPAFRSPSSVKAIQMSSPPASVFGSPRSSRRTPLPTVSRLGSPGVSAQYSPKKTPPRFRKTTPPLVLLHVTLLPLRWVWADVLDEATDSELSPDGKNLRDAWRQLQDRMGDTTCERGILLPHPQNDYEVLEERLLEALELPMRRRARILECGHYLGPANEMDILDDMSDEEFEDEDANFVVHTPGGKTHWCTTCRCDIRFDALGADKVFRVKVYASNGLMKAGAWDTCWKEMERVDVEIEPLVELGVQHELSRLQAEQERRLDEEHAVELRRSIAEEQDYGHPEEHLEVEEEQSYLEEPPMPEEETVPTHPAEPGIPPPTPEEARRLRDEERLREIYGETPATHPGPDSPDPDFTPHASPASPSVGAFERRQERTRAAQAYKSASLPELLLESVRVLMQDRKNVVILVMGLLVAWLAMNTGATRTSSLDAARDIERLVERREAAVTTQEIPTVVLEQTASVVEEPVQASVESVEQPVEFVPDEGSLDPCSSSQTEAASVSVLREVVRVVETVTETAVETATVTQTFTAVESEIAAQAEIVVESLFALESDPVVESEAHVEPEASAAPENEFVEDSSMEEEDVQPGAKEVAFEGEKVEDDMDEL